MHIKSILTNLVRQCQSKIHGAHINFLSTAIDAVMRGAHLTCTSLGRHLKTATASKHSIKRVDYMLSSSLFHKNRSSIYLALIKQMLAVRARPLIAVDWSSTDPRLKFHIIRATLIVHRQGRGLTLYEEVHPQKKLCSGKVETAFLKKLNAMLPVGCSPIILTDAGFRCGWFSAVRSLGWGYVGRVRGSVHYRIWQKINFTPVKNLFKSAGTKAKHLGEIILSKENRWKCQAVLFKSERQRRKKITVTGKIQKGTAGRKIARRQREPWLLVTSFMQSDYSANQIVSLYKKRMQIEENFRDSKSQNYGMGLKENRSKSVARIELLLLIGTLTHYIVYALGMAAHQKGVHSQFQANTVKKYQVLSYVFLGFQIWKSGKFAPEYFDFESLFKLLTQYTEVIL